ncbi:MAG: SURF1 family protein [Candidatus Eiseniibacteriota bacterium]
MLARRLALAAVLFAAALVCLRLGFWQLARLEEKRALNDTRAEVLAEPPIRLSDISPDMGRPAGRRVSASGRFDESRQVLLSGVVKDGEPGVRVVTPLILASGGAVLVDRGWLPAQDAVTARPVDYPEPGPRSVLGVVEPLAQGLATPAWRALAAQGALVWSVHALGWDSAQTHFSYPLARFTLRQLPAAGLPARPMRTAPEPIGTTMHLSYAIQWFLFAAAFAAGALFVLKRPGPRRASRADARGTSAL